MQEINTIRSIRYKTQVHILRHGAVMFQSIEREGNNYNDYQWVFGELEYQTDDKTVARREFV